MVWVVGLLLPVRASGGCDRGDGGGFRADGASDEVICLNTGGGLGGQVQAVGAELGDAVVSPGEGYTVGHSLGPSGRGH